jgi:hypothetical protein
MSEMNEAIGIENSDTEKKIAELEQIFQSLEAEIPLEERNAYISMLDELSLKKRTAKSFDEQVEILDKISKLSKDFAGKYKEFIPSQTISYLELVILRLEVSKKLISASILMTFGFFLLTEFQEQISSSESSQLDVDEVQSLTFLYTGLNKIQQIVEDYSTHLHPKIYDPLQFIAEGIANNESFKNYQGSNSKNFEQITSNVKAIRNAAKSVLWEINRYKQEREGQLNKNISNFSYKQLYEEAVNSVGTKEEAKLLEELRYWREEYTNEINSLSGN